MVMLVCLVKYWLVALNIVTGVLKYQVLNFFYYGYDAIFLHVTI